jgi:flagellar motor switch protein FliM
MSSTVAKNLSRDKIKELLAAVGSRQAQDAAQVEAAEYNWSQPYCFNNKQLKELEDFTKEVAAAIAQKFAGFYHSDFNVTIASTTQCFAYELLKQISDNEQRDYYLSFGAAEDQPCGVVGIPPQSAAIWTRQLLGDSESEDESGKELSQLEESLLLDIASAIVRALSNSHESFNFQPNDGIVKGRVPLELHGTEEICKITFNIKKADSEKSHEACLLILCHKLESVVGKAAQADGGSSVGDASKAILAHLQEMSVSVTAQLASIVLTFEEMMSLQPDDVLLLDKRIDEPAELIVEGRVFFRGRPAKSAGKYAVVVTESS